MLGTLSKYVRMVRIEPGWGGERLPEYLSLAEAVNAWLEANPDVLVLDIQTHFARSEDRVDSEWAYIVYRVNA